jgi:hypothetical protein
MNIATSVTIRVPCQNFNTKKCFYINKYLVTQQNSIFSIQENSLKI